MLKKVMFWGMPNDVIEKAREFWIEIRASIAKDDYLNFRKISADKIFHVRPKGRNRKDTMPTPSGRLEKKKAYWINSSYIKSVIK